MLFSSFNWFSFLFLFIFSWEGDSYTIWHIRQDALLGLEACQPVGLWLVGAWGVGVRCAGSVGSDGGFSGGSLAGRAGNAGVAVTDLCMPTHTERQR